MKAVMNKVHFGLRMILSLSSLCFTLIACDSFSGRVVKDRKSLANAGETTIFFSLAGSDDHYGVSEEKIKVGPKPADAPKKAGWTLYPSFFQVAIRVRPFSEREVRFQTILKR